ncbi:hypothetical protein N665_1294s0002 [Sinapis alba]|nr:hypothetical protein N665_1294s0002 [Sinapis alba]
MEWEYKDQGFKKVFKTKDLRNQKHILILLTHGLHRQRHVISLFYSPTAYIDKDMSVKRPTPYKSFRQRHIRHVMLKDPRLKSLYYPRLTSL